MIEIRILVSNDATINLQLLRYFFEEIVKFFIDIFIAINVSRLLQNATDIFVCTGYFFPSACYPLYGLNNAGFVCYFIDILLIRNSN